VVETKNGARIVGQVTKIEGGKVFIVSTAYAGDLTIKQSEVTAITPRRPSSCASPAAPCCRAPWPARATRSRSGADGELTTKVEKVAASWGPGGEDPQVTAMKKEIAASERKWSYQTSVDLTGKTGNTNSTGLASSFVATLATPQDALKFYASRRTMPTPRTLRAWRPRRPTS
jgi:hypothetical protein